MSAFGSPATHSASWAPFVVTASVLGFQTNLSAQNIVTDNQDVRAAIDRLKTFPVTLWQALHFGVVTLTEEGDPKESGGSPNARNAALKGIDVLVDRFDNVRN